MLLAYYVAIWAVAIVTVASIGVALFHSGAGIIKAITDALEKRRVEDDS